MTDQDIPALIDERIAWHQSRAEAIGAVGFQEDREQHRQTAAVLEAAKGLYEIACHYPEGVEAVEAFERAVRGETG